MHISFKNNWRQLIFLFILRINLTIDNFDAPMNKRKRSNDFSPFLFVIYSIPWRTFAAAYSVPTSPGERKQLITLSTLIDKPHKKS